jgi:GTPase SAR1 family protein
MLWDTDSNNEHESIRKVYYQKADAILFVFDLSSLESFSSIIGWISCLKVYRPQAKFLIGAKADIMPRVLH